MAVTWPDGSVTGSVLVGTPAPTPVEPEPEKQPETVPVATTSKESGNANR